MSLPTRLSWGRYPATPQAAHAAAWRDDVPALLQSLGKRYASTLPFGNGRSYGDSCYAESNHVIAMDGLNRFIEADWASGRIKAEAGVLLADVLSIAVPNGWFVPVTPGTKYVTLGGAIANDVHGKNHHVRGTFGRHVLSFGLSRSDQAAELVCSPTQNEALFAASIGGLGLTGIITWVEFQLMPIVSPAIDVTSYKFGSLAEFFTLSAELDPVHEYGVAWVDCLATGEAAGRGIYMVGDHARIGELEIKPNSKRSVPFVLPISAINNVTLRAFNSAYYAKQRAGKQQSRTDFEPFFYPLDGILHWNRIYGRRGFQQFQCVIPDHSAEPATRALLAAIARSGTGSFLAVLKRCGNIASPGLMSFPMAGTSLALDFPNNARLDRLLRDLDVIVNEAGGRLYPAKDAHMRGEDFRSAYPQWHEVEALRDPLLCSQFWKRVTQS